MKNLFLILSLVLGLTACGGNSSDVITAEQAGEYIDQDQAFVLRDMRSSRNSSSSCDSFQNDDGSFSINVIKISPDGTLRPIFTEPQTVSIDDNGEIIGTLEVPSDDSENDGAYRFIYSDLAARALDVDQNNTAAWAYFTPETHELLLLEFDALDGVSVGRPRRQISFEKTTISEISLFNSILDRDCR